MGNKYNFRKITAKEDVFVETRAKNKEFLEGFKVFLESKTIKSRKGQSKKSGKSTSYVNYLVRLFIFANEHKNIEIGDTEFFNELKLIQKCSNFGDYNTSENGFPNATINSYFEYWLMRAFEEDDFFDNSISELDDDLITSKKIIPRKKPKKTQGNSKATYGRNLFVTQYAKEKSDWSCEFKSSHNIFISKANDLPYVEAHHLIPMALQDNYNYSLDIPSNVISLCPNCHRMIHHGIDDDKKEILQHLYLERKDDLILAGITISFYELLFLYDINK